MDYLNCIINKPHRVHFFRTYITVCKMTKINFYKNIQHFLQPISYKFAYIHILLVNLLVDFHCIGNIIHAEKKQMIVITMIKHEFLLLMPSKYIK